MTITYKKFIIGILITIIIIFAIKLYKTVKQNNNTMYIEHFDSLLNKLKSKDKTNDLSNFEKQGDKTKLKKSKTTFEDLIKEAEDIDPEKYSIYNIKKDFFKYINSFNKDKFKNVTGTTTESLEKFSFFKDKFFEIFK